MYIITNNFFTSKQLLGTASTTAHTSISNQKVPARKKRKVKEEEPLPRPFQLPKNYPRIVEEGLQEGHITGRARRKFIMSVTGAIFSHK